MTISAGIQAPEFTANRAQQIEIDVEERIHLDGW